MTGLGGDILMLKINGARLGLDVSSIDSIVSTKRFFFLPGQTGAVKGIISLRGEAVTVFDVCQVLGLEKTQPKYKKIIIVRQGRTPLGLYIGGGEFSFLWKEETEGLEFNNDSDSEYVSGYFVHGGDKVRMLRTSKILDAMKTILSTGDASG